MESSFLTFSPKALARKKGFSNAVSRQTKLRLLKSKARPLHDLLSSPSNLHNIEKNPRKSVGCKGDVSDVIILDDSVVLLSDDSKNIENSASAYSLVSNTEQNQSDKQNSSLLNNVVTKSVSRSSTNNDKFEEIRLWLDELSTEHERRMRLPAWSPLNPSSYATEMRATLNRSISNSGGNCPSTWRVPESSSVSSESSLQSGKVNSISGNSESNDSLDRSDSKPEKKYPSSSTPHESSGDCERPIQKKVVHIVSSSDESDCASDQSVVSSGNRSITNFSSLQVSKSILPNKRNGNGRCSRTSIITDESIISTTSADRIISELYGETWDKESVLTPKVEKKKTISKGSSEEEIGSVDDLLSEFYGNTWNKQKVLTPLLNRPKTKGTRGKENTPPVKGSKTKIIPSNSKLSVNHLSTPKHAATGTRDGMVTKTQKALSFVRSLSVSPHASQCDPKALLYKKEFKKNKETLVAVLFKLYNREVFENQLPATLKIDWNVRMNRTAGFCYNSWLLRPEGKVRSSRIELSTKVCSSADRVRDTLIHELCHAATWIVNGVKSGHGAEWKTWTRKALKKFPELPCIRRCHSYKIETKYTYKCKKCGYSIGRHSKSLDLQRKRCGYCYGEFELLVNPKARKVEAGLAATPRTPRAASGFALYVKENYKVMKEKNSGLKHAEIMKLLGNQFSVMKVGSAQ